MKCAIKKTLVFLVVLIFSALVFAQDLKRFTIIESVREHDLNPQTTTYASDAQMLTGLYEGLFTYDPVNLSPTYALRPSPGESWSLKKFLSPYQLSRNSRNS